MSSGSGDWEVWGLLDSVSPHVLDPAVQEGMSQCPVLVERVWALESGVSSCFGVLCVSFREKCNRAYIAPNPVPGMWHEISR